MPGAIAIGTVSCNSNWENDLQLAEDLVDGIHFLQQSSKNKVIAELYQLNINDQNLPDISILEDEYKLRPEAAESIYVLWKFTGKQKYRDYAWQLFQGIISNCKVRYGFTSISGINNSRINRFDQMESFFMAETLKYLFLTFEDSSFLSPTEWVFNTEAHPLKMWDSQTSDRWREIIQMKDLEEKLKYTRENTVEEVEDDED